MGALDRLRDDVEVLARVQRDRHADQLPERLRPLAGAVDDDLALDGPPVGLHRRDAAPVDHEPGHPHLLGHGRAAHPGTLGQRLGEVGRVDLPVTRQPQRTQQVVDLHHRPQLLRALRRDHLALHVVRRRVGRRPPELDHPVLGARHDHAADVAVAGGQPGLGLERRVELGGVLHQAGPALRGPQRPHEPGGVPRRTAGEVPLFEEQHIGLAQLGQVVGHRRADHTPADDRRSRHGLAAHSCRNPSTARPAVIQSQPKLAFTRWRHRSTTLPGQVPGRSPRPCRTDACPSCGSRSPSGWSRPG